MNVIQTARDILALLPAVIDAVKSVEALLPDAGQGKAKLDLVKNVLSAAYTVGGATIDQFEAIWPALDAVIKAVVSFLNDHGIFKTSALVQ